VTGTSGSASSGKSADRAGDLVDRLGAVNVRQELVVVSRVTDTSGMRVLGQYRTAIAVEERKTADQREVVGLGLLGLNLVLLATEPVVIGGELILRPLTPPFELT